MGLELLFKAGACIDLTQGLERSPVCAELGSSRAREFCLLKGIAEGMYKTKHAETARLYYTTTYIHTHTPTELKLGHAHERRCNPNRLEQHVVADCKARGTAA